MNAKARLGWIMLHEQSGNAALVCRRCGISVSTLRKWVRSCQAEGFAGLEDRSRRPTRFIRGTAGELVTLRTGAQRKLVTFGIGVVQPGLSRRNAPADQRAILGATNSIIPTVTDHPLLVCGSP